MRNRAKCKLCNEIIESLRPRDYVSCKCDEISIDGGDVYLRARANHWENFLRIDDEGNEVEIKVESFPPIDENVVTKKTQEELKIPICRKTELLSELDQMIKNTEELPVEAMITPITHYDLCSALILIREIFKS